ncbi:UNVERIFIED_CONTAM: hypothetical protein FKN15_036038 [Acipenser sinensis]
MEKQRPIYSQLQDVHLWSAGMLGGGKDHMEVWKRVEHPDQSQAILELLFNHWNERTSVCR